jgi:hypothetical protein
MNSLVRYAGLAAAGDHYLDPRIDGWVAHGPTWIAARRLLAEEVRDAIHPQPKTEPQRIAENLRWDRFNRSTHSLRVEQVCAFLSAGPHPLRAQQDFERPENEDDPFDRDEPIDPGQPRGRPLRVTIRTQLANEFDRDVTARLAVDPLPAGWRTITDDVRLGPLAAGARATATIILEGRQWPAMADGKLPLQLKLLSDAQGEQTFRVEAPFLVAGRFTRPPEINGDLKDWPPRMRASAGRFRLLGRLGRTGMGLAQRQTVALVMQDDESLYFALRCAEPNLEKTTVRSDNLVRYEQLLACGEDLVEILLDPGRRAKGPEDLIHLVVKPNGVLIAERGVGSTPPLGRTEPFASGAEVSVGRQSDVWVVEMRIPRSAFGAAGKEEFWGVNFARFATQGQEASNWSGATRYYYHPETLGTMFVVQKPEEETGE